LTDSSYELQPIGWVESSLADPETAPKQGDEGSPDAWMVFEQTVSEGLRDLQCGTDIIVLTWLDRARRDVLKVHPRDDPANPETGVFSTRSADRPNPIGLHRVEILSINGRDDSPAPELNSRAVPQRLSSSAVEFGRRSAVTR
jgi:tRNA-Thr(GGU) m(6)t(6)A37 methyltransferase TsaA